MQQYRVRETTWQQIYDRLYAIGTEYANHVTKEQSVEPCCAQTGEDTSEDFEPPA